MINYFQNRLIDRYLKSIFWKMSYEAFIFENYMHTNVDNNSNNNKNKNLTYASIAKMGPAAKPDEIRAWSFPCVHLRYEYTSGET